MRIWVFALGGVLMGSAAGAGLTCYEFAVTENRFRPSDNRVNANTTALPKAVVEGSSDFDFDTLGYQESGEHTFVIRNSGEGPLNLSFRGYSCGQCVETSFREGVVQPGESTEVPVKFHARKAGPKFSERVEIATNDPARQLLLLQITGYVTKAVRASVVELNLGNVATNNATKASFRVFGYLSDKLEIVGHEFTNPEGAENFEIQTRKLDSSELVGEFHAQIGYAVELTIKPGLPVGPLNQTIRLQVKAAEPATIEVPIVGKVVSDITLAGAGRFISDANKLVLGSVSRAAGTSYSLRILVKGPYRNEVQLKIGKTDPADILKATIGEKKEIADGAILLYPLTIEILKGCPAANRLGTEQAAAGEVEIETTHPQAKLIKLQVLFATE